MDLQNLWLKMHSRNSARWSADGDFNRGRVSQCKLHSVALSSQSLTLLGIPHNHERTTRQDTLFTKIVRLTLYNFHFTTFRKPPRRLRDSSFACIPHLSSLFSLLTYHHVITITTLTILRKSSSERISRPWSTCFPVWCNPCISTVCQMQHDRL